MRWFFSSTSKTKAHTGTDRWHASCGSPVYGKLEDGIPNKGVCKTCARALEKALCQYVIFCLKNDPITQEAAYIRGSLAREERDIFLLFLNRRILRHYQLSYSGKLAVLERKDPP